MVRVQEEDFDIGRECSLISEGNADVGAMVTFVGLVRDLNEGEKISELTLEHYPKMTEVALNQIVKEANSRWNIIDTTIVHRVGKLKPMDQIVLVVVISSHRGEAFKACEFIMDYLKTKAPFWKKEKTSSGDRWVEERVTDEHAADRWKVR